VYAGRKINFYAEVNGTASGEHRVDDEVERRAGNEGLRREIIAAQDRVTAALGEQKPLYFALEELVGNRIAVRESAMFDTGYEHGFIQGRQEALAAVWRRTTRGRTGEENHSPCAGFPARSASRDRGAPRSRLEHADPAALRRLGAGAEGDAAAASMSGLHRNACPCAKMLKHA
jgi:hypothetical protein